MTIVFACATRALWSIQTGTPALAKGSIPLLRPQGVVLSAISLTLDAAVVRAQQRLDDPRPGRQAVGADQDLVLGPVDGVHGKRRTVALRCKTGIDRGRWCGRVGWCAAQDGRRDEQASRKQAKQPATRPDSVGEDFAPMSSGPVRGHRVRIS